MNSQTAEKIEPIEQAPQKLAKRKKTRVDHLLNSGVTINKEDPFDEAESQDLVTKKKEEEKTKPLKPKKIKLKNSSQKGLLRETIGIMIAGLLIVGTWFNFTELNHYRNTVTTDLNENSKQFGLLSQRIDELSVTTRILERMVKENSTVLGSQQKDRVAVQLIGEQISSVAQEVDKLTLSAEETHKTILSHQSSLKRLQSVIVNQNKNKKKPSLQTTAATKLKQPSKIYQLEDASLVSIDMWGSSINAVLRSNNEWIPLEIGELFKGWRFTKTQDNQALFTKNSKTIKLSIKE